MTAALQVTPFGTRSSVMNAPLAIGNINSLSNLPQGLSYTEFDFDDARYQAQKSGLHIGAASDVQRPFNDWKDRDTARLNDVNNYHAQRPPSQSGPPVSQNLATEADTPIAEPKTASDISQQYRPPEGTPPTQDYTSRPLANGNYFPQVNSYPSPQVLATTPSFTGAQIPIPISQKPRAYVQQPTYITPQSNTANPVFMNPLAQKEEICLECAMRDQDMADVDVRSPGSWDRDSDIFYTDLLQREQEATLAGTPLPPDPKRPNAIGDMLTETHLKLHLTMHPREPASRHKNLETYVKAQRLLLEAETLAHARAMQESQQLENKMRDTYSQLRRSAYEVGASAYPPGSGAVKMKSARSASMPSGTSVLNIQNHGKDITLLQNGLIVEHVDLRKEEKEERERRRRDVKRESRARKSSRSSVADVNSVYSTMTQVPTDSGFSGLKPSSRYSQSSLRPNSIMSHGDRSLPPRAYSTASFSDMQSIASASSPNRRSRFFGAWRSRDSLAPSGISGSMLDMHVALQQEEAKAGFHSAQGFDINSNATTLRFEDSYPVNGQGRSKAEHVSSADGMSRKKKKGLAKLWKIVTGSSRLEPLKPQRKVLSTASVKSDDDFPLAPPPPLSYLLQRESGPSSRRHLSTPSLPSTGVGFSSPPQTVSPPTAPSSALPSPTSLRLDNLDVRVGDINDPDPPELQLTDETVSGKPIPKALGPHSPPQPTLVPNLPPIPALTREKSLPPLPPESSVRFPSDITQTMDGQQDDLVPPYPPFRTTDGRRRSMGGNERMAGPNYTISGLPRTVASSYNEFGNSRLSLGWWEDARRTLGQSPENASILKTAMKRRSRFALSAFFGKKDKGDEASTDHASTLYLPSSDHDSRGYASAGVRMSVTSRKAIQELVQQDPDFVAYRYPSNAQPVDLYR